MTLASRVGGPGKIGEVGESAPKVERLNDEVFRLLVKCTERDQCDQAKWLLVKRISARGGCLGTDRR